MTSPTETPAPKVVCESQNCGKEYASRGGMKNHFKKSHKAPEIQSPLGKFPASDPARILFNDEGEPSTQGNSVGQVNSQKVSSGGQYICGICDDYFESKSNVDDHKNNEHGPTTAQAPSSAPTSVAPPSQIQEGEVLADKHDKTSVTEHNAGETNTEEEDISNDSQLLAVEEEVLEEAKEDQDLYDELDKISQEVEKSEKSEESNTNLVEKFERFKVILKIKEKDAKGALEKEVKVSQYYKEENILLKQVETKQTAWLVERDNEVDKLKKEVIMSKKTNTNHIKQKAEHDAKMLELFLLNSKLTKDMQDLKIDLENKDNMIKSLQEMIGVEEEGDLADKTDEGVDDADQEDEELETAPEIRVISEQ